MAETRSRDLHQHRQASRSTTALSSPEWKLAYRRSYMVQASFAIAGGFDGVVAFSALLGVT